MMFHRMAIPALVSVCAVVADVDLHSGAMVLREEIAQATCGPISVPLTLKYRSGITVDQRSSWVGTGFDLAVPYIERVPNGSADEKSGATECYAQFHDNRTYDRLLRGTGSGYRNDPADGNFTNDQDTYVLESPFYSGRILFARPPVAFQRLKAYTQIWSPIDIEYSIDDANDDPDITQWTMVDEQGNTWVFGQTVRMSRSTASGKSRMKTKTSLARNGNWLFGDANGFGEGDVNDNWVFRWYLTEVRAPIYDTQKGRGPVIRIEYTPVQSPMEWYDASAFWVYRGAEVHSINENAEPLRSLTEYVDRSDVTNVKTYEVATFLSGSHLSYLHPVYPMRIVSCDGMTLDFVLEDADDRTLQGQRRLAAIHEKVNGIVRREIRFNYSARGMAKNHPYAGPDKGLTKLNSVTMVSSDGSVEPLYRFEYVADPGIDITKQSPTEWVYNGMQNRDFFGYRAPQSQTTLHVGGGFVYPEGQSVVGDGSGAGAESWSVSKVIYGSGRSLEYTYECGEACFLTTGADVSEGSQFPLRGGIRVRREITYSGVAGTPPVQREIVYERGYADFCRSVQDGVAAFYTRLRNGQIGQIKNISALGGVGITYAVVQETVSGLGITITRFLCPASDLPDYETGSTVSLKDETIPQGINSLAQFRGRVESMMHYKSSITEKPVGGTTYSYRFRRDVNSYVVPSVVSLPITSCATGGEPQISPNSPDPLPTDYIGIVRPSKVDALRDGVVSRTEVISYNEVNGLPRIIRAQGSDGGYTLTRSAFAFEELGADGQSLIYQCMKDKHMLSQVSGSLMYAKPAGSTETEPTPSSMRKAMAITYSTGRGTLGWTEQSTYAWNADMTPNGGVDPARPFMAFLHPGGTGNADWRLLQDVTQRDTIGRVLQTYSPGAPTAATVFRNDVGLPIGSIHNASFFESGIFTGDYTDNKFPRYWDYENGWEKGTNVTLSEAPNAHFGQKSIHVTRDYAAGRNNRIYPGKAYTMSAWVKVTNGTIKMDADFHYAKSGHENDWPATQITSAQVTTPGEPWATSVTAGECNGKWKLMTMQIPSSATSQLNQTAINLKLDPKTTVWYARAWVGNDPTAPSFEAYVDDVRFHPSDALVTTTYYDTKWRQPILTVDANNNPGIKTVNDSFGRPKEWKKIDKTNPAISTLVQSKEYHLMGE